MAGAVWGRGCAIGSVAVGVCAVRRVCAIRRVGVGVFILDGQEGERDGT